MESLVAENIVQVVTDSAGNCVVARQILSAGYPAIMFYPCTTHCLELLLEDIGKFPWVPIRNNIYVSIYVKHIAICLSYMTCKSAYMSKICQVYDHMPIYVVTYIHLYEYHSLITLAYMSYGTTYMCPYM